MPGMDGVEVCARVRAQDSMQPPYLILLTARDDKESVVAGLDAGADDYLSKPYDPAELRARLEVGQRIIDLNDRLLEAQRVGRAGAHRRAHRHPNRGALYQALEQEIERAASRAVRAGVGMLDIDHFKRVNDGAVTRPATRCCARSWSAAASVLRPYDTLGRVGGEEFVLIAPGVDGAGAGRGVERVRRAVAAAPLLSASTRSPSPSASAARSGRARTATPCWRAPTMRCTAPRRAAATRWCSTATPPAS